MESSQTEIMLNFIANVKDLERKFDDGQDDYALEFLKIRVDSDDLRELDEFKSVVGARTENFRKNRYRDILPFDYSRVTIDTKPARSESGDYINASFINGANGKVAYIATQGPLKETLADFWQMIHQYEVNIVVMLCDLIESGKPKCEKYWPDSGAKLKFGDLRISLASEVRERDHFVIRTIRMKRKNSSEKERMIFQFHYFGWPDHGTPDEIAPLLEFVDRLRDYQPDDMYSPLVVHCSAGCGRTGTICALDYVKTLIKNKAVTADFSVCQLVSELRKQRPAMVQSKEQYILLHRAIAAMFEHELAQTCPEALQVNVSELFISSPPLTQAPPVPDEPSSIELPAQNRNQPVVTDEAAPHPMITNQVSPSLSSGTSGSTSISEDATTTTTTTTTTDSSAGINGNTMAAKIDTDPHVTLVHSGSGSNPDHLADDSSVTSYETISTTKTDNLSAVDEEETFENAPARNNTNSPNLQPPIALPLQSCKPVGNSSHEMTTPTADFPTMATGTNGSIIPDFPHPISERPMGAKPPPDSWPDHEEVFDHVQRL